MINLKIYTLVSIAFLTLGIFACGKKTSAEVIPKNEDTIVPKVDTVKVNPMDSHVFNKWLEGTIGSTLPVDTSEISKAKFKSFANYEKVNEQVKKNKYFETKDIKPEVTIEKEMIMLEYDDGGFQRFICQPDRVILSYHASMGDDGGSYVIELNSEEEAIFHDYTIFKVKGNIADICSDGYDDDGHYWHYGKLDLKTDSITWGKIEH